jgi:hypothetical protein
VRFRCCLGHRSGPQEPDASTTGLGVDLTPIADAAAWNGVGRGPSRDPAEGGSPRSDGTGLAMSRIVARGACDGEIPRLFFVAGAYQLPSAQAAVAATPGRPPRSLGGNCRSTRAEEPYCALAQGLKRMSACRVSAATVGFRPVDE